MIRGAAKSGRLSGDGWSGEECAESGEGVTEEQWQVRTW